MRNSANINQSIGWIGTDNQPRLTTPFRHRITAFRYGTIPFGTILLDSVADECASCRTRSCANQRASRPAVPDHITDNGARACARRRASAGWCITRCQNRPKQRCAAHKSKNMLNHKCFVQGLSPPLKPAALSRSGHLLNVGNLAIELRRKRVVAYSATYFAGGRDHLRAPEP